MAATDEHAIVDEEEGEPSWYELHDCAGCGSRIQIGEQTNQWNRGKIESKFNYNRRKYHDADCRALASRKTGKHGTAWGYRLCVERPEGACDECKAANAARQRPKQSARGKALRRLGQMFPSKLEEFIKEEMNGEHSEA